MKSIQITMTAFALLSASSAFAIEQCPDYLPTGLMKDCIVETGAGVNYDTELTGGEYDAVVAYKEWREVQAQKIDGLDEYAGAQITPVKQSVVQK